MSFCVDVDKLLDGRVQDSGSGAQYFVGNFDGHAFRADGQSGDATAQLADYGPDFYAAITWANLPDTQPDPIWIGWQSNHQSGKAYPTDPWRGAMTLPRALFLFDEDGKLLLGQRLACALPGTGDAVEDGSHVLATGETLSLAVASASFERRLTLRGGPAAQASLTFADAQATLLTMTMDFDRREISVVRPVSPLSPQDNFRRAVKMPMARADLVTFDILFDGSLIEIFVDEGKRVYSACVFPGGSITFLVQSIVGQLSVEGSCCRTIEPQMHAGLG